MTQSEPGPPIVSRTPVPKAPTHIRGLDAVLGGGLPLGRTTLLVGGPGTGKTVLAAEFLYRGARSGAPGVLVSFEERAEDLRADAASMGMDLAAQEAAGTLKVVAAEVPHTAVRAGAFDLAGLLAILEGHTRDLGAGRLVLDALDVLVRIFDDPRREREELHVLHDWMRERRLTALITAKADVDGERTYPFLDYLADCVLLLDQRMDRQVRTRRLNVVKYRGSEFLPNEHPFVLSPRGVALLPMAAATLDKEAPAERVSSGHAGLDELLGGGYGRGSCVLLAGPTGAGKTTLACTFVRAACDRDERTLYLDLEESQASLLAGMASVGLDLQPALDAGTLQVHTAMPEAAGVEQHLLGILDALESFASEHLVVDAISACQRMGSPAAAFDFLVRLLTACRQRGITCLYVNQVGQADGLAHVSGVGISSLVDTLVALHYEQEGGQLGRKLVVVKSRGAAHSLRYQPFRLTDHGLDLHTGPGAGGGDAGGPA